MTALMIAAVAAAFAGGIVLIVAGFLGPVPSIDAAFGELHRPRQVGPADAEPDWIRVLAGRTSGARTVDLAVCERDGVRWIQDRLKWAGFGGVFAMAAVLVVATAAGSATPLLLALGALLVGAVAGWFFAIVDLHSDAEKARRDVRHATASYLELVTILMAGGAGPESAMFAAADVGRGPAFRHLRSALLAAQVRQEAPWALLGQLGTTLAVPELVELGASMTLAGGGAQVKDSLSTKAASIRIKDLAQSESEAQAKSETMALPVVMMFTGFLLLLGYPALAGLSGP